MCEWKTCIKSFLETEHTPLEKGLLITCAALAGILVGMIFSPVKKGISVGSYNGNDNVSGGQKCGKEKKKEK